MNPSDSKASPRDSRRLTVTYYVEPQNLRTISIPVRRANLLIVTFGAASLWTIGSLGVLAIHAVGLGSGGSAPQIAGETTKPADVANAAAPAAAGTEDGPRTPSMVHDDPTDDVVKDEHTAAAEEPVDTNALKVELPKGVVAVAPTGTITKSEDQLLTDILGEPSKTAANGSNALGSAVASASEASDDRQPEAADSAQRASVEAPNFLYREGKFDASFKIKNLSKSELKGRVWGVATFETADGRTMTIPSATGIDSERPDSGANAEHGVTYRARVLTAKELGFEVPSGTTGHFSEVRIFVSAELKNNAAAATGSSAAPAVYISSFNLDDLGHELAR